MMGHFISWCIIADMMIWLIILAKLCMHDEEGQEWNQKSFQFIMCQITGKSSTATAGCTVRQYKNRDITISLVAALLVSIRKGSGWCISAFSGELQNLKDTFIPHYCNVQELPGLEYSETSKHFGAWQNAIPPSKQQDCHMHPSGHIRTLNSPAI